MHKTKILVSHFFKCSKRSSAAGFFAEPAPTVTASKAAFLVFFASVQYLKCQHDVHLSVLSRHVAPLLLVSSTAPQLPISFPSSGLSVQVLVGAIMCIQKIGVCPYSHREHMGLHWCSLLISRGQWNLFECSAFEALEFESPQWSCQTCLEQSAGRKTYLDTSFRLDLWRSFFRRLRPWKPRARKCAAWEMQLV